MYVPHIFCDLFPADEQLEKSREVIKRLQEEKKRFVEESREKIQEAEQTLEEEKGVLLQELSRGKQAALSLLNVSHVMIM